MSFFTNEWELEEANSGDFTMEATGTVYSKEYSDVGKYDELDIFMHIAYTSQSGATATVTLQCYDTINSAWSTHATTFTAVAGSAINEIINFAGFGTKIRISIVAAGTFGGSETMTFTLACCGKGN